MSAPTKKCLYEVLGVERTVTTDEIKRAYKKLAMIWHPDRNNNSEESTSMFHSIQDAYEILTDPQERTWYDNNRASILRSTSSNYKNFDINEEETFINLFEYFGNACFDSNFDENKEPNFYGVYNHVFERLSEEEIEFSKHGSTKNNNQNHAKSDFYFSNQKFPKFGGANADPQKVIKFYATWGKFVTQKTFGWASTYNLDDASNRRERRYIEQENEKARNEAKRKFNDTVKELVDFIKKRDPRMIKIQQERMKEEEEIKRRKRQQAEEEEEIQREMERLKLEEIRRRQQQLEESDEEDYDEEDGDEGDDEEEDDEEDDLEIYYAVSSKKNNKNYESEEEQEVEEVQQEEEGDDLEAAVEEENHEEPDQQEESEDEEELLKKLQKKMNKKNKKKKGFTYNLESDDEEKEDKKEEEKVEVEEENTKKRGSKKNKKNARKQQKMVEEVEEDESNKVDSQPSSDIPDAESDSESSSSRGKKAKKNKKQKPVEQPSTNSIDLKCNVCGETFTSKNKLFQHVKEKGHAIAVKLSAEEAQMILDQEQKKNKKGKNKKR